MRAALVFILALASLAAPDRTPAAAQTRVETRWANGNLRSSATVVNNAFEGEYRTWYQDGRPYELRHFVHGRESGAQQSWDPDGRRYLNYVVRHGRRFGFVNAHPCLPPDEATGQAREQE
jgi:hypothetical protein